MADDEQGFGANLKKARNALGWSQDRLAAEAETSKGYISDLERSLRPIPPGKKLQALASALRIPIAQLVQVDDPNDVPVAPTPPLLPIIGTVQAGAWLEVDGMDQREPETYPAAIDPRYPRARQWLSRVRGDSMNALEKSGRPAGIFDGDLVHCVDAIDIDYKPTTGDLVEVERIRFDGAEREVTLKQVEVLGDDGFLLWPRSSNPRWAEPIPYRDGVGDGEQIEVRIKGRVLQIIRPFS